MLFALDRHKVISYAVYMTTTNTIHPFTRSGLGEAPFRYLGATDTAKGTVDGMRRLGTDNAGFDHWTTPGGTCAHCGRAIIVLCKIESADGIRNHVGSDCILKVNDKMKPQVKADVAKRRRAQVKARNEAKLTELAYMVEINDYSAYPHPNKFRADKGWTLQNYVEFVMAKAGTAGKLKLLRKLNSLL